VLPFLALYVSTALAHGSTAVEIMEPIDPMHDCWEVCSKCVELTNVCVDVCVCICVCVCVCVCTALAPGLTKKEAKEHIGSMQAAGRYLQDVWG